MPTQTAQLYAQQLVQWNPDLFGDKSEYWMNQIASHLSNATRENLRVVKGVASLTTIGMQVLYSYMTTRTDFGMPPHIGNIVESVAMQKCDNHKNYHHSAVELLVSESGDKITVPCLRLYEYDRYNPREETRFVITDYNYTQNDARSIAVIDVVTGRLIYKASSYSNAHEMIDILSLAYSLLNVQDLFTELKTRLFVYEVFYIMRNYESPVATDATRFQDMLDKVMRCIYCESVVGDVWQWFKPEDFNALTSNIVVDVSDNISIELEPTAYAHNSCKLLVRYDIDGYSERYLFQPNYDTIPYGEQIKQWAKNYDNAYHGFHFKVRPARNEVAALKDGYMLYSLHDTLQVYKDGVMEFSNYSDLAVYNWLVRKGLL